MIGFEGELDIILENYNLYQFNYNTLIKGVPTICGNAKALSPLFEISDLNLEPPALRGSARPRPVQLVLLRTQAEPDSVATADAELTDRSYVPSPSAANGTGKDGKGNRKG